MEQKKQISMALAQGSVASLLEFFIRKMRFSLSNNHVNFNTEFEGITGERKFTSLWRLESISCDPWLTLHKIGATEKHTLHTFEVGAGRAAQPLFSFNPKF